MVRGIEKFKDYFAEYDAHYIIIGGTACDILEENAGQQPRATKDIDIILIVEALTAAFVKRFWDFVKAREYETRQHGNGKNEYFRFLKPQDGNFPAQIEIFARKPDILDIPDEARLTPIPVDEDLSSLSAILMNDDYYNFTLEHSSVEDKVHLANIESLICMKAKAFNDLSKRKAKGEKVDSKDVVKHKNDIFRLSTMLGESDIFVIPDELKMDLAIFCEDMFDALPDKKWFKDMGLGNIEPKDVLDRLCKSFS